MAEKEKEEDPLDRFRTLMDRARGAGEPDPTALVLVTAAGDRPSARYVLLKGVDAAGFVFFTNYGSQKAADIAGNPRAAMCFFWPRIGTEVRVQGGVERVTPQESDAYFATRVRARQLGAWASKQSTTLRWRPWLIVRWLGLAGRFFGRRVARPPFWGGFRLLPETIEFVGWDPGGRCEQTTCTRTAAGWSEETTITWR